MQSDSNMVGLFNVPPAATYLDGRKMPSRGKVASLTDLGLGYGLSKPSRSCRPESSLIFQDRDDPFIGTFYSIRCRLLRRTRGSSLSFSYQKL